VAENPRITIASETLRHLRSQEWAAAGDVLRHEGLKKGVETSLFLAGRSELGRAALSNLAGPVVNDPRLATYVSTLELPGPIGIAPGWDKTGKTLHAWQAAGAHHVTVGGITCFPQPGNPMPRLRTMDRLIGDHGTHISLNAFGFWNPGADKVAYNIQQQREKGEITLPVIAQMTLNKEFYETDNLDLVHRLVSMTIRKVLPVADAINLGLSSPNTKGMREAQSGGSKDDEFIMRIAAAARDEVSRVDRYVPIIFKGDGDGGEARLEYYCKWVEWREEYLDAFELINTTALPHIKARYGMTPEIPGGLAGADAEYQQLALDAVKYVYEAVGDRVDIIATGGCDSGEQALKMLEHGGSAIGVNTAIRSLGLRMPRVIERDLLGLIAQKYPDADALDQVVGADTRRGPKHLTREKVTDKAANAARRIAAGTQGDLRK